MRMSFARQERATRGFLSISPAILHGGASTVLALVPIAFSQTHGFVVMFRLVSLIVLFGLFHGLLLLPVLLALLGPDNVAKKEEENVSRETAAAQNGVDNPDFKSDSDPNKG